MSSQQSAGADALLTPTTRPVDGRRPMGSGSIEERDGRFRVRLRVAGKKRTIGTYATRAEAERVLQAAIDELDTRAASVGSVTLRDWIARWLEQRELSGMVRSSYDDASRLRAHVLCASFADDPLDALDRRVLRAWAVGLLSKSGRKHIGEGKLKETGRKLSRHTVAHVLATLRVCLRDAVEAGLIDENPATGIRIPAQQYTREPWTYLTQAEIGGLLSCAEVPESYRLLYAVAIYTGMRKGELWGLRWGDVYLDAASPHVMVRRSRRLAPKNGKIRMVPLIMLARPVFARLYELHVESLGGRPFEPDRLVFPAADGSMRMRDSSARWNTRRKPYTTAAGKRKHSTYAGYREISGILRHVRFHDLRHTCASHLLMGTWGNTWRLERVRDFLGHSDSAVTQRYAHLAPDMIHADAEITAGPKVSPRENLEVERAAGNVAEALANLRSHLRELNPGPTVYESPAERSGHALLADDGASVGPSLRDSAAGLLRGASAGASIDVDAVRRLAAGALLATLEAPVLRAAQDVLEATDDRVLISRAIGFASLLVLSGGVQAASGEGQTA